MYAIALNLKKSFSFSKKIKTNLFVGAQRHELSSYARLWGLNRHKKDLCLYARLLRPIWVEIFKS